jgi:hypothetical protein
MPIGPVHHRGHGYSMSVHHSLTFRHHGSFQLSLHIYTACTGLHLPCASRQAGRQGHKRSLPRGSAGCLAASRPGRMTQDTASPSDLCCMAFAFLKSQPCLPKCGMRRQRQIALYPPVRSPPWLTVPRPRSAALGNHPAASAPRHAAALSDPPAPCPASAPLRDFCCCEVGERPVCLGQRCRAPETGPRGRDRRAGFTRFREKAPTGRRWRGVGCGTGKGKGKGKAGTE